MNKNKKDKVSKTIALVILVIGFLASCGIATTGTYLRINKFIEDRKPKPIILHEFWEEGKLWFYEGTDLRGSYDCNGTQYCGFAYEMIDDGSYSLLYYNDGNIGQLSTRIYKRFAFIIDVAVNPDDQSAPGTTNYYRGETIRLYNYIDQKEEAQYLAIKNYSILPMDIYIAQNLSGKWGLIQIDVDSIKELIPFEYDFIGIFTYNSSLAPLDVNTYVVLKDGKWSLMSNVGSEISTPIPEQIYGFEGTTIVTKEQDGYNIYNTSGTKLNSQFNDAFKKVFFTEKGYVFAYTKNYYYGIYDDKGNIVKEDYLTPGKEPSFIYKPEEDLIVFYASDREVYSAKPIEKAIEN